MVIHPTTMTITQMRTSLAIATADEVKSTVCRTFKSERAIEWRTPTSDMSMRSVFLILGQTDSLSSPWSLALIWKCHVPPRLRATNVVGAESLRCGARSSSEQQVKSYVPGSLPSIIVVHGGQLRPRHALQ